MKIPYLIASMLVLASCISAAGAASLSGNTVTVTDPQAAAALVYVSGYECSPGVFYPGESGTCTIRVTNAANASVVVTQPNLIESHVKVNNRADFSSTTTLGPGATSEYNFLVTADGSDGTYFPLFTISTTVYGANAINSQIKFRIDSTDVRASIAKQPDTFSASKKDTVNVSVVNPRAGDISNVLIVPEVNGADISPEEFYAGTLKAGSSVQVPFSITPDKETTVKFHVTFDNGDNPHSVDATLPVTLGENKEGAQIIVNNIESSGSGTTLTLKGDITNNGLVDAKSVLVTVKSPAKPVNPNPMYAIGNLEPDDFSSFEVTYTTTAPGTVPLVVEYKDEQGNVFEKTFTLNLNDNGGIPGSGAMQGAPGGAPGSASSRRGMFGSFGSGLNQVPVTEIVIILVALAALIVAWRKGLLKPITDRFRKKTDADPMPDES
ncbi:MAG: hypothetical protein GYA23_02500 [Methanomicrobiales archaeon]|nr:hypothetical protein [Methanomicrobiales archaeon]